MISLFENDIIIPIFAKKIEMETTRVQTVLRLPPELMERVKRSARKEKSSFNSYVEHTLDKNTDLIFPKLKPEDFIISDEIKSLAGSSTFVRPSQEELDADPRLAYLIEKFQL